MGKCVLNFLKAFDLHERKFVVKRFAIVKTRVNKGSGDSRIGGKVMSVTDTEEVANVVMTGARKEGNLMGKRLAKVKGNQGSWRRK